MVLESPFYGSRKPHYQFASQLLKVSDLLTLGRATVEESLCLLDWAGRHAFASLGQQQTCYASLTCMLCHAVLQHPSMNCVLCSIMPGQATTRYASVVAALGDLRFCLSCAPKDCPDWLRCHNQLSTNRQIVVSAQGSV